MKKKPTVLKAVGQGTLAALPVVFACIYPIVFLVATNWYEVNKSECAWIATALAAIGLAIFFLCLLMSRRLSFSSLYAAVFMLLFLNFNLLFNAFSKLGPNWQRWLSMTLYVLLLGAASFILIRARDRKELRAFQKIVTAVMGGLVLFNCIMIASAAGLFKSNVKAAATEASTVVAAAAEQWADSDGKSEETVEKEYTAATIAQLVNDMSFDFSIFKGKKSPPTPPIMVSADERAALEAAGEVKPNVYWIILDEACDFVTMQKFYGYDCAEMNDFLIEKGFNISYNTVNRSSISNQVMADLCTLEYTATASMTPRELKYYECDGQLWTALQNLGYDIYKVCTDPMEFSCLREISNYSAREIRFRNATMVGLTQLDLVLNSTPFRVLSGGISEYTLETRRIQLQRVWDFYLNSANNYTFGTSVALVSHIMAPHTPFVYAEDGSKVSHEGSTNWEDPQYYLGQYKYTMSQARMLISNIIDNDPNCIIMLMSDHGARPRADDRHKMTMAMTDADMVRTLNAVYFAGEKLDIEGLNLVNTMRLVLTELGCDFPQLTEDPELIPNRYLLRDKEAN